MCKIAEEFREEGRQVALRETALNLKKMGMASELIAQAIGKSLEQLKLFMEEPESNG